MSKFNVGDKVFNLDKLFLMLNYFHFETFEKMVVRKVTAADKKAYSTTESEIPWDWNEGYNQHKYSRQTSKIDDYHEFNQDVDITIDDLPKLEPMVQKLFDDYVDEELQYDLERITYKENQVKGLLKEIESIKAGGRILKKDLSISQFVKDRRETISKLLGVSIKKTKYEIEIIGNIHE